MEVEQCLDNLLIAPTQKVVHCSIDDQGITIMGQTVFELNNDKATYIDATPIKSRQLYYCSGDHGRRLFDCHPE